MIISVFVHFPCSKECQCTVGLCFGLKASQDYCKREFCLNISCKPFKIHSEGIKSEDLLYHTGRPINEKQTEPLI